METKETAFKAALILTVVVIMGGAMWLAQSHLDQDQAKREAEALRASYDKAISRLNKTEIDLAKALIALDSCRLAKPSPLKIRYITKTGTWWTAPESKDTIIYGWDWVDGMPADSLMGSRVDTMFHQ